MKEGAVSEQAAPSAFGSARLFRQSLKKHSLLLTMRRHGGPRYWLVGSRAGLPWRGARLPPYPGGQVAEGRSRPSLLLKGRQGHTEDFLPRITRISRIEAGGRSFAEPYGHHYEVATS